MGTPHTTGICNKCRNPIIQWNNTGAWEHLNVATPNQTLNAAYHRGAKGNANLGVTICNSPTRLLEQNADPTKTTGNHRTAAPS